MKKIKSIADASNTGIQIDQSYKGRRADKNKEDLTEEIMIL